MIWVAAYVAVIGLFCFARRNAHDVDLPWAPSAEVLKHAGRQCGEGQVRGFDQVNRHG